MVVSSETSAEYCGMPKKGPCRPCRTIPLQANHCEPLESLKSLIPNENLAQIFQSRGDD